MTCDVGSEYWSLKGHANSVIDGFWKRGDDWNNAAHFAREVDFFGTLKTFHLYQTNGYWQIGEETDSFMSGLQQLSDGTW